MAAGASHAVGAGWPVRDTIARRVVTGVAAGVLEGQLSVASALARAQADFLASRTSAPQRPYRLFTAARPS